MKLLPFFLSSTGRIPLNHLFPLNLKRKNIQQKWDLQTPKVQTPKPPGVFSSPPPVTIIARSLHHGEAGLHEHHQGTTQNQPSWDPISGPHHSGRAKGFKKKLPETNSEFTPENGWLEDWKMNFLLGCSNFRGELLVSGSVSQQVPA